MGADRRRGDTEELITYMGNDYLQVWVQTGDVAMQLRDYSQIGNCHYLLGR
jgi:hypothetical protein